MAKLKSDPVGINDLKDYLATASDFAFEQKVYTQLINLGFSAQHGGTYNDPATGTPREFDIRAKMQVAAHNRLVLNLRIAVECKNVSENFPLLVECVPRTWDERFHYILKALPPVEGTRPSWSTFKIMRDSIYPENGPVGKSCCQVGRTSTSEISATDSGVYAKWAQALASVVDLLEEAKRLDSPKTSVQKTALIPIMVVPDERLWSVEYDGMGKQMSEPQKVNHVSYWVNKPLITDQTIDQFFASHIEFLTPTGLQQIVEEWKDRPTDSLFAQH